MINSSRAGTVLDMMLVSIAFMAFGASRFKLRKFNRTDRLQMRMGFHFL